MLQSQTLRDQAVVAAYGWSDLAGSSSSHLGHRCHATKQGVGYTLSESAGHAVLDDFLQKLKGVKHEEKVEGLRLNLKQPLRLQRGNFLA